MARSIPFLAFWAVCVALTGPARAQDDYWINYLRGDLGYGAYRLDKLEQPDVIDNGGSFISHDIDAAPMLGIGLGRRFSTWLRFDLTAERRFDADVRGLDFVDVEIADPAGTLLANTTYDGSYSALVGLANIYLDLPMWESITPYLGGGVGVARNTFSDFTFHTQSTFLFDETDGQFSTTIRGHAEDAHTTRFAWALMAGAALDLSRDTKLDLGYRYLDLGGGTVAATGLITCECDAIGRPLSASGLDLHEIRIGLRWEFDRPSDSPSNRATTEP